MHFEVYPSLAVATNGSNDVKTSQLALPAAACNQVYGVVAGYAASVAGDATNGFAATLQLGIAA